MLVWEYQQIVATSIPIFISQDFCWSKIL